MSVMDATAMLRQSLRQRDVLAAQAAGSVERILDLAEQAAALPGGLDELVARYATVPNALLPRTVSFVLAQQATAPSTRTWTLTREFAEQLDRLDDPSTAINVLTAIRRHLQADRATDTGAVETVLADFVLACLDRPPLVQATAVDLLVDMAADGTSDRFCSPSWAGRLNTAIERLRETRLLDEGDANDLLMALTRDCL